MKVLLKVFLASAVLASLGTAGAARAEPSAVDQRAAERLKSKPQAGLLLLEVTIAEPGEKVPICQTIMVEAESQTGGKDTITVQSSPTLFGKASESSTYGGIGVLDAGTYQIDSVKCTGATGFVLRGPFAKFSVQAGQIVNLGRLEIILQQRENPLFGRSTFKGDSRVVDLSARATASMTKHAPLTLSKAKKQYMTVIRAAKQ